MEIVFSAEEIKRILIQEVEVMIGNYHTGEAAFKISEYSSYIPDIKIEIELLPPEFKGEEDVLVKDPDAFTEYDRLTAADPLAYEPFPSFADNAMQETRDHEEAMKRKEEKEHYADYSDQKEGE